MEHQAGQGATARPQGPKREGAGPLPRLGRPAAALAGTTPVCGVVLVLPTGAEASARRPSPLVRAAVAPLARSLGKACAPKGVLVHVVHYRVGGWNGGDAALSADARWAVDEAVSRYGDVPVCLAGYGMGGRAALRAAGHDAVNSVVALAPWLPDDGLAAPAEPVRQLLGRHVLIVHGSNDRRVDPELSYRLAERAKKTNRDTCRFEVRGDGHTLRGHHREVAALTKDFALGALLPRAFSRPVEDALAAPPPLGLRMPLATGFGRTLTD